MGRKAPSLKESLTWETEDPQPMCCLKLSKYKLDFEWIDIIIESL